MTFWLTTPPWVLYSTSALVGLVVGSFLNVVIMRLPRMLEATWRAEARALLGGTDADSLAVDEDEMPNLSLWHPSSSCFACWERVAPWHNVPVLSWLLLRGRAACCHSRIPLQYPLVELAAAALAMGAVWRFGYGTDVIAAMLFSWVLLTAAVIDWRTQLLPDSLTLSLLWAGLLYSMHGGLVSVGSAVVGAAVGYLSLWAIFHAFRLLTGREGLGYGDFKLLAALGAWLGWQVMPTLLLLSSTVGALVGLTLLATGHLGRQQPMPFGPFIAGAGVFCMYFWDGTGLSWP